MWAVALACIATAVPPPPSPRPDSGCGSGIATVVSPSSMMLWISFQQGVREVGSLQALWGWGYPFLVGLRLGLALQLLCPFSTTRLKNMGASPVPVGIRDVALASQLLCPLLHAVVDKLSTRSTGRSHYKLDVLVGSQSLWGCDSDFHCNYFYINDYYKVVGVGHRVPLGL